MGVKKFVAMLATATLGLGAASIAVAPSANALVFNITQDTDITFANAGPTDATAYPSTVSQFGLSRVITDVNVSLSGITHSYKGDLDVMLISPRGTSIVLTSDNCNIGADPSRSYTFDDAAGSALSAGNVACPSGTYKPSNGNGGGGDESFPETPDVTTLAGLNGENPNGTWFLYVRDDAAGDTGVIGSWTVQVTTAAGAAITIPAFGSNGNGVAAPYPAPIAVSGVSGLITDVNVTIPGLSHSYLGDLQAVLVSPTGKKVQLLANSCSSTPTLEKNFTFDDAAATTPTACGNGGTFKPATNALGSLPGPAPAAPYGTTMATFNGDSPNGQWSLYVNDTAGQDGGWITAIPTLTFKTTDVIPPDTVLVGKKPENTTKTSVKIKFKSTEAGSTFKCKVDGKPYKPCTSPLKLKNLKVGKHKVFIVATDGAGNKDKKALKIKWKVFPKN